MPGRVCRWATLAAAALCLFFPAVGGHAVANCGPPHGRPLVYIYPLNESFRERGFRNCIDDDCAFGTTDTIRGTTYHHSETHELLWMVYSRLLSSPCRTTDIKTAELFFIPTWTHAAVPVDRRSKGKSFHDPDVRASACVDEQYLLGQLNAINPALSADAPVYANARRHIKVDVHANIHCEYFRDGGEPQPMGWMAKASIEIRQPQSLQWYAAHCCDHQRVLHDYAVWCN